MSTIKCFSKWTTDSIFITAVASQADHSTQMRSWPTKNEIIAAIPADGITGEALMNIFGSTMKDEGLRAHIRPFVRFDQKRKIVYLQKEPLPHGQQKDTQNTHSKSDNRTLEHRFGHAEGYIQPRSNGKDVLASGRARHMALPRRKRLSQLLHILNAVCAALHHEFGKVKPEVWDLLIDVLPGKPPRPVKYLRYTETLERSKKVESGRGG